jgi:anaerobic magnesium-protoporphyrin IX monomethyl ester cyclase
LVHQDWDNFDERHLWKAFVGKMWKTGCFETSRGCPFKCTYCNNHIFQEKFGCLGTYHRVKPVEYVIREIEHMKEKHSLELVFFNDENFLMMNRKRFEDFCDKYEKRIGLPFFIQTKAEHLCKEERVKRIKEINCIGIGIGLETGNEVTRKYLLGKPTSNDVYRRAFANTNKYNIRTTAYVMLGLPFETEESIKETAEFCKEIKTSSVGLAIFAPYFGTKLQKICVENGFIEDKLYENISVNYFSILKQPQLSNKKLEELYYSFNKMVYGDSEGR